MKNPQVGHRYTNAGRFDYVAQVGRKQESLRSVPADSAILDTLKTCGIILLQVIFSHNFFSQQVQRKSESWFRENALCGGQRTICTLFRLVASEKHNTLLCTLLQKWTCCTAFLIWSRLACCARAAAGAHEYQDLKYIFTRICGKQALGVVHFWF